MENHGKVTQFLSYLVPQILSRLEADLEPQDHHFVTQVCYFET